MSAKFLPPLVGGHWPERQATLGTLHGGQQDVAKGVIVELGVGPADDARFGDGLAKQGL
jgi:hypothetical protein